jgi:hypothetical protein
MNRGSTTVFEALAWRDVPVAADVAHGRVDVRIGQVGDDGPTTLLTAGVHGDEGPWGALAIRRALDLPLDRLTGRVTVVLAANPLAQQADARNAPLDHLDLNRSFPGDADGSHTQRLAAALAPWVEAADVAMDLHGGGSWCVNAFTFRMPGGEALAARTGAPFVLDAPDKPGTLSSHAAANGARVVALEMGGRSRDELGWADRIAAAIRGVLSEAGTVSDVDATRPAAPVPVRDSSVLTPPVGGLFIPTLREESVGTVVDGGTELGRVLDAATLAPLHVFTAPHPRTAVMLLRPHVAVLPGGAMTYVVAIPEESA